MLRVQAIKFLIILAMFFGWPFALWPSGVLAQTTTNIKIITTSTEAKSDGLGLQVYFSIPDPQNIIQLASVGQIQLTNPNQATFTATIKEPDSPIRIVLLLDASGSMANSMAKLKEAANKAVDEAPKRAEFAVFRFTRVAIDGKNFKAVQDFTNNFTLVKQAINSIQVDPVGVTCLYNATYQAIEFARNATPNSLDRRAVIVFTDGKDEFCADTAQTLESDKVGGSRPIENVIERANDTIVTPLYTIGLCADNSCSNVDQTMLKRMAEQTSAYTKTTDQNNMGSAFTTMMTLLKNQWVAQATVQAQKGPNEGLLRVTGESNSKSTTFPATSFSFDSSDTTAIPKIAFFKDTSYNETKDSYLLNLRLTNPGAASRVEVKVLQGDNNAQVEVTAAGQSISTFPNLSNGSSEVTLEPIILAAKFKAGERYCFSVSLFNKSGQLVPSSNPNPTSSSPDPLTKCVPKYDPTLSMPKIEYDKPLNYETENDIYVLSLRVTRPTNVSNLEVTVTADSVTSADLDPNPFKIPLKVDPKLPDATAEGRISAARFKFDQVYCFKVQALDSNNLAIKREGTNNTTVDTSPPKEQCTPKYNPVRYSIGKIDSDTKTGTVAVNLSGVRGTQNRPTMSVSGEVWEDDKPLRYFTQPLVAVYDNQKVEGTAAFSVTEMAEVVRQVNSPKTYKLKLHLVDGDLKYKEVEKEFTVSPPPPPNLLLPLLIGFILLGGIVVASIFYWRRPKQPVSDPLPFGQAASMGSLTSSSRQRQPKLPSRSGQESQPTTSGPASPKDYSRTRRLPPTERPAERLAEPSNKPITRSVARPTDTSSSSRPPASGRTVPETDLGEYTIMESESAPTQKTLWSIKILSSESNDQFVLPAGKGSWVIGREKKSSQMVIKDERISGQHAELRYSPDKLEIVDNRSRNGTFVGEEQGQPKRQLEIGKPHQLQDGDIFWLSRSIKLQVERVDKSKISNT
ncbi:MAG: FHA domain-containing protein [Chloroflexota bacterium]